MFFFKPASRAITAYSLKVFEHIHGLCLDFHLSRETGKVMGSIHRSQFAMVMLITNVFFRIMPVFVTVLLAFMMLWYLYQPNPLNSKYEECVARGT